MTGFNPDGAGTPSAVDSMLSRAPVECPPSLLEKATSARPLTVAVANAVTPLALESVRDAHRLGMIKPILVGRHKDIQASAGEIDWDISDVAIEFAGEEDQAAAIAVALAARQDVDAIMKGDVHTDVLLRAVVDRHTGLRSSRLISHVFHMTLPGNDTPIFISDAVLNVLPNLDQKAAILANALKLLVALGYEQPKVAILSASETPTASMPSSQDAAELTMLAGDERFAPALIDGPMAFDLAVSPDANRLKRFDSVVAGQADLLLVPNVETGNALFKMMVYFLSAAAAGLVLGAKVPIILTSRADPTPARLASIALANVFANQSSSAEKHGSVSVRID